MDESEINSLLDNLMCKPSSGKELWLSAVEINRIWFQYELPNSDSHNMINAIDSQGEESFLEDGLSRIFYFSEGLSSEEIDERFFRFYLDDFLNCTKDLYSQIQKIKLK